MWPRQGSPYLRLETISARNGPCSVCENLRLNLPSPVKIWTGEVGGINCVGDMGVRRCLARSLTSLAPMRTPKSANGPRSNSFRPDSPLTTTSPRGRKTQLVPPPHRTWSVPDASSQPQLNLHDQVSLARPASSSFWSDIRIPSFAWYQVSPPWKNTE